MTVLLPFNMSVSGGSLWSQNLTSSQCLSSNGHKGMSTHEQKLGYPCLEPLQQNVENSAVPTSKSSVADLIQATFRLPIKFFKVLCACGMSRSLIHRCWKVMKCEFVGQTCQSWSLAKTVVLWKNESMSLFSQQSHQHCQFNMGQESMLQDLECLVSHVADELPADNFKSYFMFHMFPPSRTAVSALGSEEKDTGSFSFSSWSVAIQTNKSHESCRVYLH